MTLPKRYAILLGFIAGSVAMFYLLYEVLHFLFLHYAQDPLGELGATIDAMAYTCMVGLALLVCCSLTAMIVFRRRGARELEKGFLYSTFFSLLLVASVVVGWFMM
ncbi:MAG TPA: hypothetical protein VN616_07505 [Puia sp.]|nr:hypothetical protein [Puia sp.]